MAQAFVADRVVTPQGTRRAALLLEDGPTGDHGRLIRAVCAVGDLPADVEVIDFGPHALLPGLVDSHVHINQPGRTEWEGFTTATRAAAAGGYTTLVDMPLNCLPETTTVAALEAKRASAAGQCFVDWAAWGGAVAGNQADLLSLARAGVAGFKCFLIDPGCDGFSMIDREQLERAHLSLLHPACHCWYMPSWPGQSMRRRDSAQFRLAEVCNLPGVAIR